MEAPLLINDEFIDENNNYIELIKDIKDAFAKSKMIVPMRHHHNFPNPAEDKESTLLLMPAWDPGKDAGVKIITVSPNNGKYNMPAIQGTYIYLDAHKGQVKAILDAKSLTAKRTAAASALAASFLAKEDASSLLMIGTGALSSNLILAHASVRPIQRVYIWGRNPEKARSISKTLSKEKFDVIVISSIYDIISEVDIISSATLSSTPLILGEHLKEGQHIDLVGAYQKDMRESDDEVILKSKIFVDTFQGVEESGDIFIPLSSGLISRKDIKADLFELCSGRKNGRTNNNEITVFKSVGHAIEDLSAAGHFYKKFKNG